MHGYAPEKAAALKRLAALIENNRARRAGRRQRCADACTGGAAMSAPAKCRVDFGKQLWSKDPSWYFVRSRLRGADDCDRVIDDLLDTDIPLSRKVRRYIKDNYRCAERRERNRKRSLALIISHEVDRLADRLSADFTNPKTRAQEYLARHWREVFGKGFSSGRALHAWVQWTLKH